jgi:copper chaperone
MHTISLTIDGMHCGHCVAAVRQALESVPGVAVRDVRIGEATIETQGDPSLETVRAAAREAVRDAGYAAEVSPG